MHARKPKCVWNDIALKVTRNIFTNNPKIALNIKNNSFLIFKSLAHDFGVLAQDPTKLLKGQRRC